MNPDTIEAVDEILERLRAKRAQASIAEQGACSDPPLSASPEEGESRDGEGANTRPARPRRAPRPRNGRQAKPPRLTPAERKAAKRRYVSELRRGGTHERAAVAGGLSRRTFLDERRRDPAFAAACEEAREVALAKWLERQRVTILEASSVLTYDLPYELPKRLAVRLLNRAHRDGDTIPQAITRALLLYLDGDGRARVPDEAVKGVQA